MTKPSLFFLAHIIFLMMSLMVATLSSRWAHAEQQENTLTVGLNTSIDYQAYKGKTVTYTVLPMIFFDNDLFYAEGDEAGIYLINDENNELRLNAYYDGNSFSPHGEFQGVDRRDWSVMAGMSYLHITPYGGFKLQAAQDTLGRHRGQVFSVSYLAAFEQQPWLIYPEFGVQWVSKKYNQYYFAVNSREAADAKLQPYQLGSSVQPYASLVIDYRLNKRWDIFTNLNINYLSDKQYNSPMVKSRYDIEQNIGLNYTF
ncbi:MipA/OmpV family protein [Acinetobacter larvae]|uniref:MltA-interacting protein MipA n=1 Tax=Acinetobacter larvae TaxID=1789224 RepID=A0A1B2LXC9_9GAMM|nr:MipA/OmpV family protein [Acinetobacter larvae]AOA57539.1 MltA-interacting protein MipA [Acinetobacter larvae]